MSRVNLLECPLCHQYMTINDYALGFWIKCKPCRIVIGGDSGFKTIDEALSHYFKRFDRKKEIIVDRVDEELRYNES